MVARQHGGPEVLEGEEFTPPQPGPGEVLFETEAIGLNFIDTYYRAGLYKAPLPIVIGSESAGIVSAVGPDVTHFAPGDRIGCFTGSGAYATHRICPAAQAVKLPPDIDTRTAAATMVKGFTACYLAEDIEPLEPGQWALVHSAAGGTGSLLTAWLRYKGVKVIAHVGSPDKAKLVQAEHVLTCPLDELASSVRDLTNGQGVAVVFDGVGKDSWQASLRCLRRRGMMISFGNASGAVPPVSLLDLMAGGSLRVTRPTLADFTATPEMLQHTADRVFDRLRRGVLDANIRQTIALADAAEAHRALESRQTTGATVLIP
ncbi:MAG: quinone oxidoreductase [Novosphingobium sp.]|nr:quinone oxidoreductase [Novosphingobium sp.]